MTVCFLDNDLLNTMHIVEYLCLYCSRSLEKVRFYNISVDIIGFINQAFYNVIEISLVSCVLSGGFEYFSLFFPNVKDMYFRGWNSFSSDVDLDEDCDFVAQSLCCLPKNWELLFIFTRNKNIFVSEI